jgi:hypothetical protein
VFIVLATLTNQVHRKIRGSLVDVPPPQDVLYLPKGEYVKVIALGFDSFMADVIWLRTLQYFGGHFMYDKGYPILDRMIDVVITLEPTFIDAYSFGAMALHEEAKQTEKADALMQKGIENNPKNWNLAYEKGFIWFEEMRGSKDSTYRKYAAQRAVASYAIATSRPDCPEFVGRIIPQMYSEIGWKSIAKEMWTRTYEEAVNKGDKYVARIAEDKLDLMQWREYAAPVQQAVMDYYKKYKKIPASLQVLIAEGFIKSIPIDHMTNKPLKYDTRTGRIVCPPKPQFAAFD